MRVRHIHESQMEFSFIFEEDIAAISPQQHKPVAVVEEEIVWSDQEIIKLHEALLKDSLQTLQDGRCNAKTREEIMRWVRVPLVEDHLAEPFSLQCCCRLSELNAEELRGHLLLIYSKHFEKKVAC